MKPPRASRSEALSGVLRGISLLARGRREGFAQFAATPDAFLASLGPLIAFPLVGMALMLLSGYGLAALDDFFPTLCAILAPPVLSHALARHWQRETAWLAYATAFNWCRLLVLGVLLAVGLPREAAPFFVLGVATYMVWLDWFLARRGLDLGRWRAAALVIVINLGTAVLAFGPPLMR